MLAQVILNQVDNTLFIGFQPPDEDWRTKTMPGNTNSVNIYLTELRENRRLRTNERIRTQSNGDISLQEAPRRVDCHYLVTAWSPAAITPQIDPTRDEHCLIHAIATAFSNADPLLATNIFASVGVPAGFPSALLDYPVEVTLLPVEGFHKYAEFWGTMGYYHSPWKPGVYMITTLPLLLTPQFAGPMVTDAIVDFEIGSTNGEVLNDIGGTVRDNQLPPQPVPSAWVELLTTGNERLQLVNTDSNGQFVFVGVPSSSYRLRATGPTSGPVIVNVDVPSPNDNYDLQL